MFKNGRLRLLMTLCGFRHLGDTDDPQASWIIPSAISAAQLKQALDLINKNEFSPPIFDDGHEAEDFLRRKSAAAGAARRRVAYDDENSGIDNDDVSEEELFPAGGPTVRKANALKQLKKSIRRRRQQSVDGSDDDGADDEKRKAREEARKAKEIEKQRKIKSALYVNDSDEETDEERDRAFFAREEETRNRTKGEILKELLGIGKATKGDEKKKRKGAVDAAISKSKKRRAVLLSSDEDSGQSDDGGHRSRTASRRTSSTAQDNILHGSGEEIGGVDTPLSSPHVRSSQTKRMRISSEDVASSDGDAPKDVAMEDVPEGDDEEEDVPVASTARRRMRAGFVFDSDSE